MLINIFFYSFERYIRICFYCQLKETSILTDENIKFYKLFVIVFPAIFYIPKFFEVNSHYEEIDVKREIDCGKYLRIGQMLNDSRLRPHIIRNITVDEVVYLENLAVACKVIIDNENEVKLNVSQQISPNILLKHQVMKSNNTVAKNPIKVKTLTRNEMRKKTSTHMNSTNTSANIGSLNHPVQARSSGRQKEHNEGRNKKHLRRQRQMTSTLLR